MGVGRGMALAWARAHATGDTKAFPRLPRPPLTIVAGKLSTAPVDRLSNDRSFTFFADRSRSSARATEAQEQTSMALRHGYALRPTA
jgi:hypothetical protein